MAENAVIQLVGPILNFFDAEPAQLPPELLNSDGLPFVAMDGRAFKDFTGGQIGDEWVVSRKIAANIPELHPWPNTGWRFQDQAKAREAYQKMRAHILAKLPGIEAREDRSPERGLLDAENALGEIFSLEGEEAVYLSCDRATEASILKMLTDRLEPYSTKGAAPQKFASYNTQTAPHYVGVAGGEQIEHVVVAFTPGDERDLIAAGLRESVRETDLKPFQIEVPSGILVLSWSKVNGSVHTEELLNEMLADNAVAPMPTSFDQITPAPVAWMFRVRPGTYAVALRWLETADGISAMALSHVEAKPLWADQFPRPAAPRANPSPIAAAPVSGDVDPIVFPGQPLAKLSDYVKLMKGIQKGDMMGAISAAGLDMMSYGKVASAWGMKMATDPGLAQKYALMIMKA